MMLSRGIGNLVWLYRRRIVSAIAFAAGVVGYALARPYLVACGDGKRGLGPKLIACALHWFSGQ